MDSIINRLSQFSTRELGQEFKRREILEDQETINRAFDVICNFYKTTQEAILFTEQNSFNGHGKESERKAKRALAYVFRHHQKRSTVKVGLIMMRTHSACSLSANKVRDEMNVNPNYKKEIESLIGLIELT